MRLIFYIPLIIQLLNSFDVFAQKVKEDSSQLKSVKWERVEEKAKPLKKWGPQNSCSESSGYRLIFFKQESAKFFTN